MLETLPENYFFLEKNTQLLCLLHVASESNGPGLGS
jgi:hypothetical protein